MWPYTHAGCRPSWSSVYLVLIWPGCHCYATPRQPPCSPVPSGNGHPLSGYDRPRWYAWLGQLPHSGSWTWCRCHLPLLHMCGKGVYRVQCVSAVTYYYSGVHLSIGVPWVSQIFCKAFGSSEHALPCGLYNKNWFWLPFVKFCYNGTSNYCSTLYTVWSYRLPPVSVLTKPAIVMPSPLLLPRWSFTSNSSRSSSEDYIETSIQYQYA